MVSDTKTRRRTLLAGIAAFLLIAHGAIHLWWLSPPADAEALVDPANAWVVQEGLSEALMRGLTLVLAPLVFLLFMVSAIGVLGWLLSPRQWRVATLLASALSLLLLGLYFDPSGWVGFVVDLALILGLVTPVVAKLGLPRARRAPA